MGMGGVVPEFTLCYPMSEAMLPRLQPAKEVADEMLKLWI